MTDFAGRAEAFVRNNYRDAVAAFLGGSAGTGVATANSDLDILVVLPTDWAEVAFVETTTFQGQIVEAFVYGEAALDSWLEKGRADRRPVLDRLIAEGIPLTEGSRGRQLARNSKVVLADGPSVASDDERRARAYSLSGIVDDMAGTEDPGERFVMALTAWREAAELALLVDRRWLGTGKWLLRELRQTDDRFGLVRWSAATRPDTDELERAARSVLQAAGGYFQSGFIRGAKPRELRVR